MYAERDHYSLIPDMHFELRHHKKKILIRRYERSTQFSQNIIPVEEMFIFTAKEKQTLSLAQLLARVALCRSGQVFL